MKWIDFFQKGMSEDNGNPSARRIVVVYAGVLLTTLVAMALFVVIWWIPILIMEMTIAVLAWISTNIITGIVAKGKEQKVTPTEQIALRAQEAELKTSDASQPPVQP